ncbi:MAG: prepilin-type N-terminal cleavage/methylation domain-containing protein [Planctomycetaceae bacterium]
MPRRSVKRGSAGRDGFTMIEMLLVLGVIAVIIAVAWPNVIRLTGQQRLLESSDKVRSLASSARIHAIESGLVYQFRYEPGGRRFVVIPFEREFESVSPDAQGTGASSSLGRFSKASGLLPEGVSFAAPKLPGTSSGTASGGQKLSADLFSGLADAAKLEQASWSGPILFQPDGTGTDIAFEVVDRRNQRVTVTVRGVTGAVTVSRIHQMEKS